MLVIVPIHTGIYQIIQLSFDKHDSNENKHQEK